MEDRILQSIFLDIELWKDALQHGVDKGIPIHTLEYIQSPVGRAELCRKIANGTYSIAPPHTGYAKKDNGEERIFFVNEPLDRILLYVICRWLNRNEQSVIHDKCLSYKEHIGVGRIVRNVSKEIGASEKDIIGCKFDIHHYFDTVPREDIHRAFDMVECHYGSSSIISLLRKYYDSDIFFDTRKQEYCSSYHGLKQGCAVSSWLANAVLYPLDCMMAKLPGVYTRYSDDILYIGEQYDDAALILRGFLQKHSLKLNETKTRFLKRDEYFRFLGFDIKGQEITLSKKWVKRFQDDIDDITIKNKKLIQKVRKIRASKNKEVGNVLNEILQRTIKQVCSYLYYGNGTYSWASAVLPVVNREKDLAQLNDYCLDAIRAVYTGKTNIGGLGKSQQGGIVRGKGRNVAANRRSTVDSGLPVFQRDGWIMGFCSLRAIQKLISNKWLYRCVVCDLLLNEDVKYGNTIIKDEKNSSANNIEILESVYSLYLYSQPDDATISRFYAHDLSEMNLEELMCGENRKVARSRLNSFLAESVDFCSIVGQEQHWYWQSENQPELVLLKKWFHTIPLQPAAEAGLE